LARGSPGVCHSGIGAGSLVHTFFEQNAKQRGSNAFAHRPAFERRADIDAVAVALGDDTPFPGDHESCSQGLGRIECCIDSRPQFCCVDLGRQRLAWNQIAHRPRFGGRVRQSALNHYRSEMDGAFAQRQRHASLAA